jgi:hypothetical protein
MPEAVRHGVGGGSAMNVIDLNAEREARRRAEWDRWHSAMDERLEELQRASDELTPLVEQWIERNRGRRRPPPCEAPGCQNGITSPHPVRSPAPGDAGALVRLCGRHLSMVRGGRIRVRASDDDTLLWQLFDHPDARPRLQVKLRRRKRPGKQT